MPDSVTIAQTFFDAWNARDFERGVELAADDLEIIEVPIRGTNTGPFVTPAGEIAPTGRTVKVPFSTFLQIRGGKVAKVRHYYDIASLMSQLGISPEIMAGATA
jgi:ketosteroid isomerase-like protein